MNKLSMTINTDANSLNAEYNCEMTLSKVVEESWKEFLNTFLELETLQGERTELPDGMIRYRMNVCQEKQDAIRKAFSNRILTLATEIKN